MRPLSLWLFSLIVLAGCSVDVNPGNTEFACQTSTLCPAGQLCINELCVLPCTAASCVNGTRCVDSVCIANDPPFMGAEILNYSFDDYFSTRVVHDRSGNRLDAYASSSNTSSVSGKYGLALQLLENKDSNTIGVRIPYYSNLYLGNTITIESYLLREEGQSSEAVIYGNHIPNLGGDYSLELRADNTLEFVVSDGCSETITFQSSSAIQTGVWQHLAVTWDGASIVFYIDGIEGGRYSSSAQPCAVENNYVVGARGDGTSPLFGIIDEVKVSDYAKSAAEIVESMNHNSSSDVGSCGDRLLENEECLADEMCCSDACETLEGASCGAGTCNSQGACVVAGGRVSNDLVVLYEFNEGSGGIVSDSSGVAPALDLQIDTLAAVNWQGDSLRITQPVVITSTELAAKVVTPISASNEFSIEAWITPANATQNGPSRIVSISIDSSLRDLTLGQAAESYSTRIMTTTSLSNGLPPLDVPQGEAVAGQKTHLLVTRSSDGMRRFYVNGRLRSETTLGGTLASWVDYPLSIANEVTGGRPWLGEIFLAAIYSRALSQEEVARNFSAGSD